DLSYNSSRSVKYSALQPKASLSYKIGANDRIYATASKGFRSGGFNSVINTVATAYSPETLWNYEVGIKTESQDHALTANAAVFFEDYKNSQQFQFDGKTATQTIFNIRKSRIYGAELDVEARTAITGLSVQASAGILDSKIQSTDGLPGVVAAAVGDVTGKKLPIINHWTFMVGGQYTHGLSNGWTLTPSVDFSGRGRQYWYIDNVNEAPSLFLLNGALVLNTNASWKVVLSVKNMLDRKWYSDYESQRQTGLFTDVVWPQAGRVFLGTVAYSF
ncbi:MAG: TonB-dependent receptor, partial [Acidobacteriota bacterium]|nr:TonB-dependent receptor [Acidobacteriota bacterium]